VIVVIACKNGAAAEVARHALRPQHVKVALEVAAAVGVAQDERALVAQRCAQCLRSSDEALVAAALRCAVAIGEVRALPVEEVTRLICARNMTVRGGAMIALARMCAEGVELGKEVAEIVVGRAAEEPIARTVIAQACKCPAVAMMMVEKAIAGEIGDGELWMRIMIQAVKHSGIMEMIREAMRRVEFHGNVPGFRDALEKLKGIVNAKA
jgi:hypothetical protein